MHSKNNNKEIVISNETDEIIQELFDSLLQKYRKDLKEELIRGSGFVFDSVNLLRYKCLRISLIYRSYIDSPEWIKNKKREINPKNNDDKCFKYVVTVVLS